MTRHETNATPVMRVPSSGRAAREALMARRVRLCGLVGAPMVVMALLGLDYLWVTEDAYITFRSVENLWRGFGPNFNRDFRVESFSHPLWFMILCVLRIFGAENLPLLSALVGVAMTVAGVGFAAYAASERFKTNSTLFPLGALTIAVLHPFWQFASSGLESGLTFLWLGVCSWIVCRLEAEPRRFKLATLATIGLGPVIRPDLVIFSIALLVPAYMLIARERPKRFELFLAAVVFLLPAGVWQVFRMGYYGALVPMTYLAKEGAGSRWDQGWAYLLDLMETYHLVPLLVVGLILLYRVPRPAPSRHRSRKAPRQPHVLDLPVALCCGALVHGMMVCRAGGDFMHARLLLPALFALLAAFAVIPLPRSTVWHRGILSVFSAWAAWVMLCARPSYKYDLNPVGIADERFWYLHTAKAARPINLDDYHYHGFYIIGESIAKLVQDKRYAGVKAIYWAHIGIASAMMPSELAIIDPLALNDHIGARIILRKRDRPGHEKIVPAAWFTARYPPGLGIVVVNQLKGIFSQPVPDIDVAAVRELLLSPPFRELHESVAAPMSIPLFMRNLTRAWRLTFMRIPPEPLEALRKFIPSSQLLK